MHIEDAILLAFATTVISEVGILLALWRRAAIWPWVTAIVLINSLTHPLTIYALQIYRASYIAVELAVALVEMCWYRLAGRLPWKRAFWFSTIANLFSIAVGVGIRLLLNM